MSKRQRITLEVTETITRRITLVTTSQRRAKELVEAGPLSYLKAVEDERVVKIEDRQIRIVKDEVSK